MDLLPSDILPRPENTLLLIIDAQERLATAMPTEVLHNILRNTCRLIETAGEFGMPVVVSEHYPKGLGSTLAEIRTILPESTTPVEKITFSCCQTPTLRSALEGREHIMVCGMETHVCVLQTALDLLTPGRSIFVAADATCSRTRLNWQLGLDLMRQAGAVIGTTEIFIFGLLGAAGTDRFKRLSKLVK